MILKLPVFVLALLIVVSQHASAETLVSMRVRNEHIATAKNEKCEDIRVPLCRHLPYTRFNTNGDRVDQNQILNELSKYEHYFKLNCSAFFESFICSYHLPLCSKYQLLPCKELCQQVQRDCSPEIAENEWPDELKCHKFQAYKDTRMCFKPKELDNVKPPPVIKVKSPLERPSRFVCPIEYSRSTSSRYVFRIDGFETHNCSYPCKNFLYDQPKENQAHTNILIMAAVSLLLNLFLQITYCIDTSRFQYPLKTIVHISFYCMLVSALYLAGYAAGDAIACDLEDDGSNYYKYFKTLANDHNLPCTASFALLNFFTTCALLWWLMLAITLFLQMAFMWGTEVIEPKNALFHAAILTLAGLHTMIIVRHAELTGDPLSGLCTVQLNDQLNYLILPQFVVLLLGLLIFAVTIGYFFKIKQILKLNDSLNRRETSKESGGSREFENFVHKLLVFLLLCLIGYAGQFAVYYYERHNFDLWVRQWIRAICERVPHRCLAYWNQPVKSEPRPSLLFVTLKYSSHFLPCIACGALLFCRKTLTTWSEFFKSLFKKIF